MAMMIYLNVTRGLSNTLRRYLSARLRSLRRFVIFRLFLMDTGLRFLSWHWRQPIDVSSTRVCFLLLEKSESDFGTTSSSTLELSEVFNIPLNQILSDALILCVKFPKECSALMTTLDSWREFKLRIPLDADDETFTSISYSYVFHWSTLHFFCPSIKSFISQFSPSKQFAWLTSP